ncbi:MAG: hypothetical protein MK081_00550 [Flavobacteriales bacterium]|nr:hypothetical protein [Flavobacteriales bacterium]
MTAKHLILSTAFVLLSLVGFGQDKTAPSDVDAATIQTNKIVELLNLDQAQKEQVYQINLETVKEISAMKTSAGSQVGWDQLAPVVKTQQDRIAALLTADQKVLFKEMNDRYRERMIERSEKK